MASRHRCFIDFGGFSEPSWEAKTSQNRSIMASKKRWKKDGCQNGQKGAVKNPKVSGPSGSWPLGRTHPFMAGKPLTPPIPGKKFLPSHWFCSDLTWPHQTQPDRTQLAWSDLIWPGSDRILSDFRFQLGVPNPPKSIKNQCQDAFPCWPHFLMDFCPIFVPNLYPQK